MPPQEDDQSTDKAFGTEKEEEEDAVVGLLHDPEVSSNGLLSSNVRKSTVSFVNLPDIDGTEETVGDVAENINGVEENEDDTAPKMTKRPSLLRRSLTSSGTGGSRRPSLDRAASMMMSSILKPESGLGRLPLICILVNYISAGYILLSSGESFRVSVG